ncbi:MAG TPA: hypothetical protein VEC94_07920 [Pseudolabrys sp.]|nr:hypothetical protein [Pseudolabrys sp.]
MRNFLIVASLASLVGGVLTEAAAAAATDMTPGEVKAYCEKKDGYYTEDGHGGSSCQIGTGRGAVVIGCGSGGKCTINHTMVFSSSSSKHGPADQAPASTLAKGSKNSNGAGTASIGTLAGNTSPNHVATNSNGVPATTRIPAGGIGGGGLPQNGRPRLQQQ